MLAAVVRSEGSMVGWRGDVGGGEEEEEEEMVMASGGLGRRRLLIGCGGNSEAGASLLSASLAEWSELVSEMSSLCFSGRWGRRESGDE